MGRPKNFSREEVLEKAMPVFWKHGFARPQLRRLLPADLSSADLQAFDVGSRVQRHILRRERATR
jgi:hypothetical protein